MLLCQLPYKNPLRPAISFAKRVSSVDLAQIVGKTVRPIDGLGASTPNGPLLG